MDDTLNSRAYDDVCEERAPSLPENEEYMKYYRFWRNVAPFREDNEPKSFWD